MGCKKEKAVLEVGNQEEALMLFGQRDDNLRYIEREAGVSISHQSGQITVAGPNAGGIVEMMRQLLEQTRRGGDVTRADLRYGLMALGEDGGEDTGRDIEIKVANGSGRKIKPMSPAQRKYLEALGSRDLVFAVGPAGTGKTFLAVALAVRRLMDEGVKRIIICRPAVEAGEKLGFLPGDFQQKVDPYLRPIYDALFSMMNIDRCARYLDRGIIEVAPLAYMRGRTLEDAFVIMDEAQNTTVAQMKMFLTRLGRNSKAAVTGDITQTDLPEGQVSGLVDAIERLKNLEEISFVRFTKKDVVRHKLVSKIIEAYEGSDEAGGQR